MQFIIFITAEYTTSELALGKYIKNPIYFLVIICGAPGR